MQRIDADDRRDVIAIAQRVLSGELDPLLGCRLMVRGHRHLLESIDPSLVTLVGIESETDHLPLGNERVEWDTTALAAKDKEKVQYLSVYGNDIVTACRFLVSALGERAM